MLTVNHASGAGYYAMAGQGFDPDFIFSWPTGRMGVMEGEAAVQAVHGPTLEANRGKKLPADLESAVGEMHVDYDEQIDARRLRAHGVPIDAIVCLEGHARGVLDALCASRHNCGPHLGTLSLPAQPSVTT